MQVLVIDDDADVLRLLEIKLTREGHDVSVALTGAVGAEELRQSRPELVILETEVSGIPGLDIVRTAKEMQPAPLVLILSHKMTDADIAAGFAAGADDYLTKPFSPRVLTERIRIATIRNA